MTPGQRADYRRRAPIARVRKVRPVGARYVNANDYAAEFEAMGGTFEDWAAGVTLDELRERVPVCRPAPIRLDRPYVPVGMGYVPVPWRLFDSADRYHPCEVQS